jgi:hypothetical protein
VRNDEFLREQIFLCGFLLFFSGNFEVSIFKQAELKATESVSQDDEHETRDGETRSFSSSQLPTIHRQLWSSS